MCSRLSLAALDVAAGMRASDAARLHGVRSTGNIHDAVKRLARVTSRRREIRREVIRARIERKRASNMGKLSLLDRMADQHALEEWPDLAHVPGCDGLSPAGADHAEIPDPPHLLEVGWRTTL